MHKRLQPQSDLKIENLMVERDSPLTLDKRFYDSEFLTDMQDLFSGRRAGHAFHHVMTGKAFELWEQFTRAADSKYYPFKDEAALIQSNPDWFRIMAGLEFGEGSIVVEMGTGSEYSALQKTIPFLEAVNGIVYVGVDKSFPSVQTVTEKVRETHPDISTIMRLADFNTDNLQLEWHQLRNPILREAEAKNLIAAHPLPDEKPRRRVFAQFGLTLGNLEGAIDADPPLERVVECLSNYAANMDSGDTLFLGVDHNQDENSLHDCYGSPLIAQFSMAMLHNMAENLPVKGFKPDNFEYVRMWNRRNGLYYHGFNTKVGNTFRLGGEDITMPVFGKKSYVNAWKHKDSFWERAFRYSGLHWKDALVGPAGRIHIHALEKI